MSRILGVLVALGVARLLPEHGAGLWFRLGAATLALLLPFAGRGAAEALARSLGALFVSLAITFAVHASLSLTLVLYALLAVAHALFRSGSDAGQTPGGVPLRQGIRLFRRGQEFQLYCKFHYSELYHESNTCATLR